MGEVIVACGFIFGLFWLVWFVIKKIVYGLFYTATRAIKNAKRKDYEEL